MTGCCGMAGWMMIPGLILLLVVVAGVIALAVWAVRRSGTSSQPAGKNDAAYEALKRRYAQGEIDSDEFERMKRQLDES